jgi:hypothetical protein
MSLSECNHTISPPQLRQRGINALVLSVPRRYPLLTDNEHEFVYLNSHHNIDSRLFHEALPNTPYVS